MCIRDSGNRAERESGHEKVGKRVIGQEYRNDEDHRAENLRAGVHPDVYKRQSLSRFPYS